ncbi:hypothetical protein [Butyrivibrio proteoclasticus]|uniref:hypothetical protein n=1 Tax=Butyrivibrio proteoclasticus TaxID=43305 RepID=UPI001160DE40|nr:hypothetical protein [Butyrivibrio proteoclasticus]
MATPTYLAGLDWMDLISQSNYYGYGMKWLFFPAFMITSDPVIIFIIFILAYIVLISLVYAFFYGKVADDCVDSYTNVGLMIMLPIVSCICSYHSMSSEPTLYLAMGILMLIIYDLLKATGYKYKALSFFCAFWLCYMLSLHERCLVVIAAFMCAMLFDRFISKRWFVDLKLFIASFLINYALKKIITSHIISIFWNKPDLANTTAVPKYFPSWIFQSKEGLLLFFGCVFANFFCLFIKTFGIGILSAIIIIKIISCLLKNSIDQLNYEKNRIWFVLFTVSMLSIVFTIGGLCLKCRNVLVAGEPYSYKNYTYVRYYFSWVPVLMISTWVLYNSVFKKAERKQVIVIILGGYGIIAKWFYAVMLPILEKANAASLDVDTGKNFRFYLAGIFTNTNIFKMSEYHQNFLYSFLVSVIILLIIVIMNNEKKLIGLFLAFFIMLYNQTSGFNISLPQFYSSQDAFYKCISYIENNVNISKDVYCPEGVPTVLFTLQYMINRYSVHNSYPIDAEENTIAITWSDSDDYEMWLKDNGYVCVELEKNKFIWTRSEEVLNKINEFMELYDA